MIDSVYREDKDYYLKLFLEECKCLVKEKMMGKDGIEISSDDSDREDSFNEETYVSWIIILGRRHPVYNYIQFNIIYPRDQITSWHLPLKIKEN